MGKPLWEEKIFPEKLFRLLVLICIVGWGLFAIYVVSNHGSFNLTYIRARALAATFFGGAWIFAFFYAQYRLVPRLIHRDLDQRVSTWHAVGSVVLFLIASLQALSSRSLSDFTGNPLVYMAVLGECVFIGNIIWTNVNGRPNLPPLPGVTAAPARPDVGVKNTGWPQSPVKLFGIGAGFFGAGALVSLILNVPSFKVPVPWSGQIHFVSFFVLWLAAGAPFAIFAGLYKYFIDAHRLTFAESTNRIHFIVTIITVLDLVHVFVGWEQGMISDLAAVYFGPQFFWLAILFLFSSVVFAVSAIESYRRTLVRT